MALLDGEIFELINTFSWQLYWMKMAKNNIITRLVV